MHFLWSVHTAIVTASINVREVKKNLEKDISKDMIIDPLIHVRATIACCDCEQLL